MRARHEGRANHGVAPALVGGVLDAQHRRVVVHAPLRRRKEPRALRRRQHLRDVAHDHGGPRHGRVACSVPARGGCGELRDREARAVVGPDVAAVVKLEGHGAAGAAQLRENHRLLVLHERAGVHARLNHVKVLPAEEDVSLTVLHSHADREACRGGQHPAGVHQHAGADHILAHDGADRGRGLGGVVVGPHFRPRHRARDRGDLGRHQHGPARRLAGDGLPGEAAQRRVPRVRHRVAERLHGGGGLGVAHLRDVGAVVPVRHDQLRAPAVDAREKGGDFALGGAERLDVVACLDVGRCHHGVHHGVRDKLAALALKPKFGGSQPVIAFRRAADAGPIRDGFEQRRDVCVIAALHGARPRLVGRGRRACRVVAAHGHAAVEAARGYGGGRGEFAADHRADARCDAVAFSLVDERF
mmetsp:Transcript_31122/g.73911  ORF Transcript_31122/g.73911 Transcript_31122/m.73911 type:complete len:415 (-) Transcript_31122:296-1540(-)